MKPIALFRDAARNVPAYRHFLAERGVDPARVRSMADFSTLPIVTKENYLRAYPLAERCRGGSLDGSAAVALSSGSSGQPTIWPRTLTDELAGAARFEQIFRVFGADEHSTLAVVCFPLGNWIGGMYTAAACRQLAARGYRVTVATPGNHVEETLRVVEALGPEFDQVVLLGYPPFVKNVIDAGTARQVDWRERRIKLVLAGEVFSERWRDLVAERAGIADPVQDIAALYGTADAGVLANETPRTVRIRRRLAGDPERARKLFGDDRLPTLAQYDPAHRYFEEVDGTLLFTADGAVPLIRYEIGDTGGITPYAELAPLAGENPAAPEEPFVHVFGRSLFAVSIFGANIFPENVSEALERPEIAGWTTGRFVMRTPEDADGDRYLDITVELAPGSAGDGRAPTVAEAIRAHLIRRNSEFANYVPAARQTPAVQFRPVGDPENFPVGVKHRYSR
ncbi:phenylacetate--CoA ligase family protein [Actinoplanes solisilvae]|uniref:phenylacetate--CoA ligase family protein n=1 Tax=Actinoplanes solisilvae TaxID=2486853 RepID=UPI000FD705F2|nr:phenylacetate--CoA ligase family protein [Actinoplanes solisilvae]